MILLKIFDIKDTMLWLLAKDAFDGFFLEEAQITTFAGMTMKGRRCLEWYDSREREEYPDMPEYIYWKEAKPFIFSYIRGKKTPGYFQITLRLSREEAVRRMGEQAAGQEVDFLMHFRFEKDNLSVITGCAYHEFTMEKRMEFAWDEAVQQIFRELQIGFQKI